MVLFLSGNGVAAALKVRETSSFVYELKNVGTELVSKDIGHNEEEVEVGI
jgi:hypothetical protein